MNMGWKRVLTASMLLVYVSSVEGRSNVKKDLFGKLPDGTPVDIYTLSEGPIEVRVTNYGGYRRHSREVSHVYLSEVTHLIS
jgi:hypothetical protein